MSINLKLCVEVVSASNLMPKDGQGSSSSFVELHFDNQKFRTTVKDKDLSPVWNERYYFNISDPDRLGELALEAYIYNNVRGTNSKSFLGKVRLAGTSFVPISDAVVMHYPLEKRSIFSRVKGELGLKVFLTNDPSVRVSNPLPSVDPISSPVHVHQAQTPLSNPSFPSAEKKSESKHTFRSIPKDNYHQQPQPSNPYMAADPPLRFEADEMKAEQPRVVRMFSGSSSQQPVDFALKETSPVLGGGRVVGGRVLRAAAKPFSTYDLVEPVQYLFVRVVKAKDLPTMDLTGSLDPYVEVKIGNYKGKTRTFEKTQKPEWNEVFAFSRETIQASHIDVLVKDKDLIKDDFVGMVRFEVIDIPTRVPPDSPLAPEWYRLENKKKEKVKGELMLAVWFGTQADEAFPEASHSDADSSVASSNLRSKVYHAPRLWYVRVLIIEVQDLVFGDKTRVADVSVKVQIGNQVQRTRELQSRTVSYLWNQEEFLFVAAEPFEDHLIFTVEDHVAAGKEEVLGRVHVHLSSVEKRADDRQIRSSWFDLDRPGIDLDQLKKGKFSSKIHLRLSLEGGYHVLVEPTHYSSDLRPTARQLSKQSIGVLELGILSAEGLHPMKTRNSKGVADTYCVAKYGNKWVRTRTIIDNLSPKYNEQYTWEVFDPATVLTVGVFDNSQIGDKAGKGSDDQRKDMRVGKVRIRLSTLQTGRVYTHSYPLLLLQISGVKKMGELHLAIRFSSTSFVNIMYIYSRPLLPKLHYTKPLLAGQIDFLRQQAVKIIAARLGRTEPPLRKEVIEYMSDFDSHLWSMRKSKANFFRLMAVFSSVIAIGKWFSGICVWSNPITTVLVHIVLVMLACFPEHILPTVFLYLFLIGLLNYRYRPQYPPHMNIQLSHAGSVHPDELDEEFDNFPTTRSPELVKLRYDRLRSVAGRIQTEVGNIATQGERIQALISWRDPRATALFLIFCLIAALVVYVTPVQLLIVIFGFYLMRHPKFRNKLPSAPSNFFRRLPAKTDCLL